MKPNYVYTKRYWWSSHPSDDNVYVYRLRWWHHCRNPQTTNERRQNRNDYRDEELKHYKVKLRARRRNIRTSYDDPSIGRTYKKSWKDFTKARRQYMKNWKEC